METDDDIRRFEALFHAHAASVRGYAARRLGAEGADEVVAETFLVAWRRLDEIPAGAELAWLYGVARRQLANHARGERRRIALVDRIAALAPPPAAVAAPEAADPELMAALATLSAGDRELLCLVAWEGLSPADLAVALDVSPVVARTRLARARRRARTALARGRAAAPAAFPHPREEGP